MALKIIEDQYTATVVHRDPVLPSNIPVVHKRQAFEALDLARLMTVAGTKSCIHNGEVVTIDEVYETLRKFIMTR